MGVHGKETPRSVGRLGTVFLTAPTVVGEAFCRVVTIEAEIARQIGSVAREEQGSAIVEVSLESRYRRNRLGGSVLESLLTVHAAIAVEMPPDNLAGRQIHFLVREVSQGTVLRLVYVLHHPEAGLPLFGEEFLYRGGSAHEQRGRRSKMRLFIAHTQCPL